MNRQQMPFSWKYKNFQRRAWFRRNWEYICQEKVKNYDRTWRDVWPRENNRYQISLCCVIINCTHYGNWVVSSFCIWRIQIHLSTKEHHEAYLMLLKLLKDALEVQTSINRISQATHYDWKAEDHFSSQVF